jgi:hypothetical protein
MQGGKTLTKLNYDNSSVLDDAWREIDQGVPVDIEITSSTARKIAHAFPHYLAHQYPERNYVDRKLSLLKWATLGAFSATTLWAICNRARLTVQD